MLAEETLVIEIIKQGMESALRPLKARNFKEYNKDIIEDRMFMEGTGANSLATYCHSIGAHPEPIRKEYFNKLANIKDKEHIYNKERKA